MQNLHIILVSFLLPFCFHLWKEVSSRAAGVGNGEFLAIPQNSSCCNKPKTSYFFILLVPSYHEGSSGWPRSWWLSCIASRTSRRVSSGTTWSIFMRPGKTGLADRWDQLPSCLYCSHHYFRLASLRPVPVGRKLYCLTRMDSLISTHCRKSIPFGVLWYSMLPHHFASRPKGIHFWLVL